LSKTKKKEKRLDAVCYWQSDASPTPAISIEKYTSRKQARIWLKEQVPGLHSTPKIGVLTADFKFGEKQIGLQLSNIRELK